MEKQQAGQVTGLEGNLCSGYLIAAGQNIIFVRTTEPEETMGAMLRYDERVSEVYVICEDR